MRKITNTEEVNQFYDLVNDHIDEYIIKHKVRPSNLKKYFDSKRIDIFLKKYKLDDVDGIKRVVRDVVEDRLHAEKDKIIKFESFINEDMGNIQIDESGVTHERILADLYNTSIGHVTTLSLKDHKYGVTDLDKKINVVIYSKKDVYDFKNSIIPMLVKEVESKKIDIEGIDVGLESKKLVKIGLKIPLNDFIDEEKLENYLFDILIDEKLLLIIRSFINDRDFKSGTSQSYVYKEAYRGYHIWELAKNSI